MGEMALLLVILWLVGAITGYVIGKLDGIRETQQAHADDYRVLMGRHHQGE